MTTARIEELENWPPAQPVYEAVKRCIDVLMAVIVLVALSPLWLMIALAIKLTSPGPVLFRGPVVGKDGRVFTWYKFRTMVAGDDLAHRTWLRDFVTKDAPYSGTLFKLHPDPRVTTVGMLLRRSSLDEIPQLINVLVGQMSVVGPRPPVLYEYELYTEHQRQRLAVRPGITGLYQVTGRSRLPFTSMVELDLRYICERSILLDLRIMVRTVGVVLRARGAL
jgi:lipopolysaccharide/colanic/teichoic acid biosynthesis glycosyltransferase